MGGGRLKRLGWNPPSGQPNWSRVLRLAFDTDYDDAAQVVTATLEDGFGTTDPVRFRAGEPIKS